MHPSDMFPVILAVVTHVTVFALGAYIEAEGRESDRAHYEEVIRLKEYQYQQKQQQCLDALEFQSRKARGCHE